MSLGPLETDPPLVVDTNAVLAPSVPLQGLEAVPGQCGKVINRGGRLQPIKLEPGGTFDTREGLDPFPSSEISGPPIAVAGDHDGPNPTICVTSRIISTLSEGDEAVKAKAAYRGGNGWTGWTRTPCGPGMTAVMDVGIIASTVGVPAVRARAKPPEGNCELLGDSRASRGDAPAARGLDGADGRLHARAAFQPAGGAVAAEHRGVFRDRDRRRGVDSGRLPDGAGVPGIAGGPSGRHVRPRQGVLHRHCGSHAERVPADGSRGALAPDRDDREPAGCWRPVWATCTATSGCSSSALR